MREREFKIDVQMIRNRTNGLAEPDMQILIWIAEERLRFMRRDPQPARPIPTGGLTGQLREVARSLNAEGIRQFRAGTIGYQAFAESARPPSVIAQSDVKFQRALGLKPQPPTQGK